METTSSFVIIIILNTTQRRGTDHDGYSGAVDPSSVSTAIIASLLSRGRCQRSEARAVVAEANATEGQKSSNVNVTVATVVSKLWECIHVYVIRTDVFMYSNYVRQY